MAEIGWRSAAGWRVWLAVGLAGFVIVVVLLARLSGDQDPAGHRDRSSKPRFGNDSVAELHNAPTGPSPQAVSVATGFMHAWLSNPPGQSAQQWWQRVSAYSEPSFARQLQSTDPARVPAHVLRGQPMVTSVSTSRIVFSFDTDAGAMLVTCVRLGEQDTPTAQAQTWKVNDIEPADIEPGRQSSGATPAG